MKKTLSLHFKKIAYIAALIFFVHICTILPGIAGISTGNLRGYRFEEPKSLAVAKALDDNAPVTIEFDREEPFVAEAPEYSMKVHGELLSSQNHGVKSLALGLAQDTKPESLAIYLSSLRVNMASTDVILFVNSPVPTRHFEIAKRFNAVLIEYEIGKLSPEFINRYHPSSLRWIFFHRLLIQHPEYESIYEKIMFTDVRDVAFQSNPFELIPANNSFYTFSEFEGSAISQCAWNSGWIRDCFNEQILSVLQNNAILCSGVSLASMDMGKEYLRMMAQILLGEHELTNKFPKCERNGVDQGIHNVLMHLGLVKNLFIKSENTFPVVHMQNSMIFNSQQIPDQVPRMVQLIENPSTHLMELVRTSIIHQYDRFALLAAELATKYVYWKDMNDVVSLWRTESACLPYHTWSGADFLAGSCDSGQARAFTPDECCERCAQWNKNGKKCTGFAYSAGVCYFKSCKVEEANAKLLQLAMFNNELIQRHDWSIRSNIVGPEESKLTGRIISAYQHSPSP